MRSTLSAWATSLVESTCLAAVVVVPVFYNVYSHESFEPDKVWLLRSLTALTLAAAIVWCIDAGRTAWTVAGRPIWRAPLVAPVLALTGAYGLATACSIVPRLSLLGSYLRAQGAYTWMSYVTVFLGIVLGGRERQRWDRLITAMLLASAPVSLYAVIQIFNADPIDWGQGPAARVTSTAGNPIFLAAFLVMVLPLTLARLLALRRGSGATSRWTWNDGATAAPYVALLGLQVIALLYAQSRGPMVGLAFGLATFVLLAALLHRVRWPVLALGGIAAMTLGVLIAVRLLDTQADVKGFARLSQVLALYSGSGRVRTLAWEGVTDLLRRNPMRAVVGHGPETLLMAFAPVYPAALSTYERPDVTPDRAHNEILDALAATGVIGCAAELVLFVALFAHVLRWLGVLTTTAQRNRFLAAAVSGGLTGGLIPIMMGHVALAALGLGLGLATGVLAYLAAVALQRALQTPRVPQRDAVLLAALFAAVLGHFVEMQAGIGTSITRLYFFVYAGVAVAIGLHGSEPATGRPAASNATPVPPVVLGLTVALLFVVLTFDLYTPNVDLHRHGAAVGGLFLGTWLVGALLVCTESPQQWPRRVGVYAGASVAPWMLFLGVFAPSIAAIRQASPPPSSVAAVGSQLVNTVALAYAAVFACVVLMAASLTRERGGSTRWTGRWQAAVVTAPLLIVAAGVVIANFAMARDDCFAKLGVTYERPGSWSAAVSAHERAQQSSPWRQEYAVNLARALIERARRLTSWTAQQRDADAARAVDVMEALARVYPLNPDLPANLARIYRKWARFSDAADRPQRWERADAAYQQALALWPTNTVLWNERALLYLERGQSQKMWDTFEQSLRLNNHFMETYVRRAQVFVALQRFDDAAADYRRVRRRDPDVPFDAPNLARLYQETQQTERALAEARVGLAEAAADERPPLERLIALLEASRKAPPAGN